MLGYDVMIWRSGDEQQSQAWNRCLARWETGINGLDWLDQLAGRGSVEAFGGNGYPLRYRIRAGTLAEVLKNGPPANNSPVIVGDDYRLPAGYNKVVTIDMNKLSLCQPDEWLIVHAWDMS